MPRHRPVLVCLAVLAALVLFGPASALASSAGDTQYCDPLNSSCGGSTHTHTGTSPTSTSPSGSSNSGAQSPSSQPASTSSSISSTSPGATGAGSSAANTLPRTGFDELLGATLGLVLLGTGLALRRATRRA